MTKKKNLLVLVVLVLFIIGVTSSVRADYYNPPGWDSNPYFTHQSWEFTSSANPTGPEVDNNQFGPPHVTITSGGVWVDDFSTVIGSYAAGRSGGWMFTSVGEGIDAYIPNEAHNELVKEIWVQATVFSNDPLGQSEVYFTANNGQRYDIVNESWDFLPEQGWARYTAWFEIDPQPADEIGTMRLTSLASGTLMIIDEFDVDTRCVPEPATIALLALGPFLLIVNRRKRRI